MLTIFIWFVYLIYYAFRLFLQHVHPLIIVPLPGALLTSPPQNIYAPCSSSHVSRPETGSWRCQGRYMIIQNPPAYKPERQAASGSTQNPFRSHLKRCGKKHGVCLIDSIWNGRLLVGDNIVNQPSYRTCCMLKKRTMYKLALFILCFVAQYQCG